MAVDAQTPAASGGASGRRMLVGTNVLVGVALTIGIVAVFQAIAYSVPARWDFTSTGINSVSEGTENLLRGLDANIRLTSLYFETDREEEDQQSYRRAALNLIDLYEATNRTRISAQWINPLKDHEKLQDLMARLREKSRFTEGIESYRAPLDTYKNDLDGRVRELIQSEIDQIDSMGSSIGGSAKDPALTRVEMFLSQLGDDLARAREQIDTLTLPERPQYSAAVNELRTLYRQITKSLKDLAAFGQNQASASSSIPPNVASFLGRAGSRCAAIVSAIEAETTKLQDIEALEIDDLLRQLTPTSNALLVETEDDARVVEFESIWPPIDPRRGGGRPSFRHRAFKGEEKLTAAILRTTHKEQTAVVFVRYGGPPLFGGGFMPNQPQPPYAMAKTQLEDANFVVEEWDLKAGVTPPAIDPEPTRTIFVVLKPTPPQRGPFGQPGQDPPFGDMHRRAVLGAIKDGGRALFVAGWAPGPFGMMPSTYEYNDYLTDAWGIHIDTSALLIGTSTLEPGKYIVARRDFHSMKDVEPSEHEIVHGLGSLPLALPWCAPIELSAPPEGVTQFKLLTQPARDGLWGVKNIQEYENQLRARDYMTKIDGDLEGPFDLAVGAQTDEAKIVVIGSREFATDAVAFAREIAMAAQGFTLRMRNPGNATLLINSLHWLNDNSAFMNIGKPIESAVLEMDRSTVKFVQALTIVVWPLLALGCGGVVWWVRRR